MGTGKEAAAALSLHERGCEIVLLAAWEDWQWRGRIRSMPQPLRYDATAAQIAAHCGMFGWKIPAGVCVACCQGHWPIGADTGKAIVETLLGDSPLVMRSGIPDDDWPTGWHCYYKSALPDEQWGEVSARGWADYSILTADLGPSESLQIAEVFGPRRYRRLWNPIEAAQGFDALIQSEPLRVDSWPDIARLEEPRDADWVKL